MKLFYSIFAFILCFISCSDDFSNKEEITSKKSPIEIEEIVIRISNSFISSRNSTEEFIYPNYYGGMYTNDKGELIVLIKGNIETGKKDIIKRAKCDNFKTEQCEYSFNELNELNTKLSDLLCKGDFPDEITWNGVGILVDKNKISIDLEICSDHNIQLFKRLICDSPAIVFGHGTPIIINAPVDSSSIRRDNNNLRNTTLINPGGEFSTNGVSNDFTFKGSIGFKGIRNGKKGFVTASHCIPKLANTGAGEYRPVYLNNSHIGNCVITLYTSGLDLAFVELKNEYETSNTTEWSKKVLTNKIVSISSLQSLSVTMNGISTNSNYKSGKILAVEKTKTIENKLTPIGPIKFTAKHLVFAQYPSQSGDSGGIVYTPAGNIAGVHCGSGSSADYGQHAFFT